MASHIELAGVQLIARQGYADVTVADIGRAAGVSAATVARYFPLKEDILLAQPRRSRQRILEVLVSLRGEPRPVTALVRELQRLAGDFEATLGDLDEWIRAIRSAPEVRARALGEDLLALVDELTGLIAEALGVDPDADLRPSVLATAVIAAIDAMTRFWSHRQGALPVSELLDVLQCTLSVDMAQL
ncbi:MAG: putative TetR family transcriptional regulator [Frankiales bacterium]|nr:putative TetR family transcriptional regulator [Frankiales bacterium]